MADSHAAASHPVPSDGHGAAHAHDHSHEAEHIAKHIRGYIMVGGALILLTGVTVGLSYVDFDHMFAYGNMIVGMIVATFKASLVAAIFMHLKGEKITIWRFLIFTAFFVFGMFMLTLLHESDPIMGTRFNQH